MSTDPLRLLWDALEAHDCRPRGKPYEFRAHCPAHRGDNRSSPSVGIGADDRALVHCLAHGCPPDAIVAALGLQVADLFPDGHHRGRRHPLRPLPWIASWARTPPRREPPDDRRSRARAA